MQEVPRDENNEENTNWYSLCHQTCIDLFCPQTKVKPILSCGMCFEDDAKRRICCNAVFCDHCYTKDKICPNCGVSTKQEKLTGATYTLPLYSEHEECRVCLEPGLKRNCCSNYYCDECYYSQPKCRSCDAPVGERKLIALLKALNISVTIGWLVTIFFTAFIAAFGFTILANEQVTPVTLSGYKCYGFFRKCTVPVCISIPANVAAGLAPIPSLSTWQYCDLNSVAKLESTACVYDKLLYDSTDQMMGFDVCTDIFIPGVYIFEDNFENWQNETWQSNKMATAHWDDIVNGHSAPDCGHGKGNEDKALIFNGGSVIQERYATTKDVDLSFGGWIEFEMFLSPIGYDIDPSRQSCKTNYDGNVFLQYSLDNGHTWTIMKVYTANEYRSRYFFYEKLELVPMENSTSIRFRFEQTLFAAARDAWALDNVKIFQYQPSDWQSNPVYQENIAISHEEIQAAQCCFDSDWCKNRLTRSEMNDCKRLPWYHNKQYEMRDAEIVLLITVFVNILKFIYVSVKDFLVRQRYPFQNEFEELTRTDWIMKYVPQRYRPKKELSSFVANIHTWARIGSEAANNLSDEEGIGDRMKKQEELAEEREEKRILRMQRLKKKIDRREQYLRLKNNRFAIAAAINLEKEIEADVDEIEEEKKDEKDLTKFGTGIMTTEVDKIKRSEMAMLRVPFNLKMSNSRFIFAYIVIGVYVILIVALISVSSYYTVNKTVNPYGAYQTKLTFTSYGINFLALMCDFKEIWWTLWFAVPIRSESSLDMITIDRSDEVNSLFIGRYTIPMEDIYSINNFSRRFALFCGGAYMLGCFPWCIMSLILRNAYLDFNSMRVVTPLFGGIMLMRSLLGPGIFIKMGFTMSYFYSKGMKKRERIGIACQADKTRLGALHGALGFAVLAVFLCSAFAVGFVGQAFAISLVTGAMYGALTAVTHGLPIHPWMQFTCFDDGCYLVLRRKESCPCVYWGSYCTDMHDMQEVFMMYTTHDLYLLSLVKAGNGNLY